MTNKFAGFPQDLFGFLADLANNNNRDWFNAHKERYHNSVAGPMCAFIAAMAPRLEKISKYYVADPRPHGGSMFRIYRDTRFAKDKRPYKEHIGCHFRHVAGKDAHAPGFYAHFEPRQIFIGGGVWMPPGPVLHKICSAIAENPEEWARLNKNKTFRQRFGRLEGDKLTRPPRGFAKDHPQIEDIKRKSFFVLQTFEPALAQTPRFLQEVEKVFKAAGPMMDFLTRAVELKYR